MNYTAAQTRQLLEITPTNLRYLRDELSALHDLSSARERFTPSDVLALCVIRKLMGVGFEMKNMKEVFNSIFKLFRASAWPRLNRQTLVISMDKRIAALSSEPQLDADQFLVILPLAPIIASLSPRLNQGLETPQADLPLTPRMVRGARR